MYIRGYIGMTEVIKTHKALQKKNKGFGKFIQEHKKNWTKSFKMTHPVEPLFDQEDLKASKVN